MGMFLKIENNVVVDAIIADSKDWCEENLDGEWIETFDSYPDSPYKVRGSVGDFYIREFNAFIPPKPFDSWTLDTEFFRWNPPKPFPENPELYIWNEEIQDWVNN